MRKIVIALSVLMALTSCVSKKEYAALEAKNKDIAEDKYKLCIEKLSNVKECV